MFTKSKYLVYESYTRNSLINFRESTRNTQTIVTDWRKYTATREKELKGLSKKNVFEAEL